MISVWWIRVVRSATSPSSTVMFIGPPLRREEAVITDAIPFGRARDDRLTPYLHDNRVEERSPPNRSARGRQE
jgi:hypothetical protein